MENVIYFISSNYRKLYVEDIYRALALPKNYVIQYRYQFKYVATSVLLNKDELIGKRGIIYYYYNPNYVNGYIGTIEKCEKSILLPIREVFIKDIEVIEDIKHINFFLELGEFLDCKIYDTLNTNKTYPDNDHFVDQTIILDKKPVTWLEKIESIEPYFKEIKFFHIRKIFGDLHICYDFNEKRTNLVLKDESTYIFELLTYDKSAENSSHDDKTKNNSIIELIADNSYLTINDALEKGTKVNSKKITILTKPIDYKKDMTNLKIKELNSDFSVNLSIRLEKTFQKSIKFGLFSAIVLLGVQIGSLITRNGYSLKNMCFLLLIAFFVTVATAFLHRNFNKK
jgi:hypothetical protein